MTDQSVKPDPFRDEVRRDSRNLWFLMRTYSVQIIVLIGAAVVIGWLLVGSGIVSKSIEREVVTHSRPYVETQRSKLLSLNKDYLRLGTEIAETEDDDVKAAKTAQRRAVVAQMREEADRIPWSEVPAVVKETLVASSE